MNLLDVSYGTFAASEVSAWAFLPPLVAFAVSTIWKKAECPGR